jgi:Serine/Threonine/Tyrosine Kinase found in polyvalent proteins
MNYKEIKNELKNIIHGKSSVSHGELIQTIALHLRRSKTTSALATTEQYDKKQETAELIRYINSNHLWVCDIDFDLFISEGAEQKVYVKDDQRVLKLNDSIYYAFWEDYFNNLLLNNYFFPETAYNLLGFYKSPENILYALVEQNYIKATQPTDLKKVKQFLENNGFANTKNHDYYNADLGIILEDLHDENVLTANGLLYFIDTVFYIKTEVFWN